MRWDTDIMNSVLTRFVLANRNLVNSYVTKHCDTKMPIGVYYCARMRARTLYNNIYGVGYGVAVCYKGNTRASIRGTAILRSRFFVVSIDP